MSGYRSLLIGFWQHAETPRSGQDLRGFGIGLEDRSCESCRFLIDEFEQSLAFRPRRADSYSQMSEISFGSPAVRFSRRLRFFQIRMRYHRITGGWLVDRRERPSCSNGFPIRGGGVPNGDADC